MFNFQILKEQCIKNKMEKIRVLVVDDSVFMRNAISKIITTEEIEVIGTASNGADAIEKVKQLNPTIVTMDIEMPVMDGLTAVQKIMEEHPVPILMLSTLTSEGADATIKALEYGAVDFITKKAAFAEMNSLKDELISKITSIARNSSMQNRIRRRSLLNRMNRGEISRDELDKFEAQEKQRQKTIATAIEAQYQSKLKKRTPPKPGDIEIIGIGISTGGPTALMQVIPNLKPNLPVPILIAQHMPPFFTKSLAERLNAESKLPVKEIENNERIRPGSIYIGQGGSHFRLMRNGLIQIIPEVEGELYKPSANLLFESIAQFSMGKALGVIMTGMGDDGKRGLITLSNMGGYVISQDFDSCVVTGMPSAALNAGVVNEIIPLNKISDFINSLF